MDPMSNRCLVVRDDDGRALKTIDVSDVDNTDATRPLSLSVETRCSLGEWHAGQQTPLVPWGPAVLSPS